MCFNTNLANFWFLHCHLVWKCSLKWCHCGRLSRWYISHHSRLFNRDSSRWWKLWKEARFNLVETLAAPSSCDRAQILHSSNVRYTRKACFFLHGSCPSCGSKRERMSSGTKSSKDPRGKGHSSEAPTSATVTLFKMLRRQSAMSCSLGISERERERGTNNREQNVTIACHSHPKKRL